MKTTVVIPTYNEAKNIKSLAEEILKLSADTEVLVVDDNSPDKTYEIVDAMAKENSRARLLLRKENRGRGWAGIDGFKKALSMGSDFIIEMDGDFSHSPKYIPDFIKAAAGDPASGVAVDIVIGSRFTEGGRDEERSFLRKIISWFARNYLAAVLGLKVCDPTSGFRLFSRRALEKIVPHLKERDPFIVTEVLFYAKKYNMNIVEVPIEFAERAAGESKLKATTLIKYLFRVWKLKFRAD